MEENKPVTRQSTPPREELAVNIVSADENVFDGTVYMLTSKNNEGEFDVLPLHTNFITLIEEKIILHKTSKEKKEIPITNGVLKVAENQVSIILGPFVGADLLPEDILQSSTRSVGSKIDKIKKLFVD